MALTVLDDGEPDPAEVQVAYPTEFDLFTATDLAGAVGSFQSLLAAAGALPVTEGLMLSRLLRLCLPGLGDPQYARCDEELEDYLERRAGRGGSTPETLPERPTS
jgi:hypothetical protein